MISKGFIKSSVIYTFAGALPMTSAFILLPFYIIFLPESVYGTLSLYLSFSLFIQILVIYSFDTSIYVHYHDYKNDPVKLSAFISSAFVFMLLIAIATGIVVIPLGELVFELIFEDKGISFYPFGILAFVTGVFQALFKVYTNLLQSREKPVQFLWANLIVFSLIAGLTIAGLYIFPETLVGPVGSRAITGFLVMLWVLYRISREFGVHFNFSLLSSTFGFNHYSFIYQVQQWLINYSDRFIMLFAGLSLDSIGVYDFALKCLIVIEVIMNGLNNSFLPKVISTVSIQTVKTTTPEINRYYHGLIAVVMLMVSGAILVLPFVVEILGGNRSYQDAIPYFPYIAVIYILKSMRVYFAFPYGTLKYMKPLPMIYSFVVLLKIGLMILLVKQFQVYGLVIASLISLTIELIILKYQLRKQFTFKFNVFKMLIAPVLLLLTVMTIEPVLSQKYALGVHIFYFVLTVLFLLWIYRRELNILVFAKTA